jgi:hypothetical protein
MKKLPTPKKMSQMSEQKVMREEIQDKTLSVTQASQNQHVHTRSKTR